jgi:ABC-type transporter Mla maintaining outer membrane lipid asymmetry ATPase subunit MlaF
MKKQTVIMVMHTLKEYEKILDRTMVLVDGELSALKALIDLLQMKHNRIGIY